MQHVYQSRIIRRDGATVYRQCRVSEIAGKVIPLDLLTVYAKLCDKS